MRATPPPLTPPPLPSGLRYANPPAATTSCTRVMLTVVMWVVWFGVTLVADFLGFMMFAFADSPGAAGAAKLMIGPAFAWFAFTFIAGAILLFLRRAWQIVLAFVLAASPPFVIFAGYNVLDGAGSSRGSVGTNVGPATSGPATAPVIQMPPGGFAPPEFTPREQPDFRKYMPVNPTTRPSPTTRP